ncbi:uncharacterized protein LOC143682523 [Tamandua tetradactyla]|uniref:uncharacterized protein LOC143682523 n=1 Tax=Tamandua tetradactyla TaxID=48850 RepID=UPI00405452E5
MKFVLRSEGQSCIFRHSFWIEEKLVISVCDHTGSSINQKPHKENLEATVTNEERRTPPCHRMLRYQLRNPQDLQQPTPKGCRLQGKVALCLHLRELLRPWLWRL